MSDQFKPYDAQFQQPYLMPPSLQDWLPEDHLAFFICDALEQIDLQAVYRAYGKAPQGQPSYDPLMMIRVLIYAYCKGIFSSRRIERATYEDVAFRMLSANQHPDHDTFAEFRKKHLSAFGELFKQVLLLCDQAGIVKLGTVALDGSKIQANASKHKAMSYERMQAKIKEVEEQVRQLNLKAEQADREEDERHGKGRRGDEMPQELRKKQARLEKMRQAKNELEQMARQQAEEKQRDREQVERDAQEQGRAPTGPAPKINPTPDPKSQRNFTDPESRIMKGPNGFMQAYNVQAVVDAQAQVIVACDLSNCAIDMHQAEPLIRQIRENLGRQARRADLDAGYYSEKNVRMLIELGIDPYIATGRQKHAEQIQGPPRGRIPGKASAKDRMRRKLLTQEGRKIYSRRKVIVEPVFGQIKNRGFRKFSLRGLKKTSAEWSFVCMTHNLLKLYRAGKIERPN